MSNYDWLGSRKRKQHLVIVEGNHEKNELINELLQCFPEIDISLEDIIIYGTNIYMLYQDIEDAYPGNWWEQDVDLPMIVSRKKQIDRLYKNDFTNVLIIFDYERHDPKFSEEKINRLQRYFHEVTDVGQLYLNYPMIESYQDFISIPDETFMERRTSVNIQKGSEYKNQLKKLYLAKMIGIPVKIKEILLEKYGFKEPIKCIEFVRELLSINYSENILNVIEERLTGNVEANCLNTAKNQIAFILKTDCMLAEGESFFDKMKSVFKYIIEQNILKSYKILTNINEQATCSIGDIYLEINQEIILEKQNEISRDLEKGFVWVLNMSLLFVPEYSTKLIE